MLIYLLWTDRAVEIVADRGIDRRGGQAAWQAVCREMEGCFREGRFEEGLLSGIRRITAFLVEHYPKAGTDGNELPDRPAFLEKGRDPA